MAGNCVFAPKCPGDCDNHGDCINGVCKCHEHYEPDLIKVKKNNHF